MELQSPVAYIERTTESESISDKRATFKVINFRGGS